MAWNTINHTCGHQDTIQLYGPTRDREKRVAWGEQRPCPTCYKAEQDKARAEATAQARLLNTGLPQLAGTDKEIAWAETLRAAAKTLLETLTGLYSAKATEVELQEWTAKAAAILRQTSAKYWIHNKPSFENREACARYILRSIADDKAQAAGAKLLQP